MRRPFRSCPSSRPMKTNSLSHDLNDDWEDVNMTDADSIWDYCVNTSCVPTIDDQVDRVVNM